MSVVYILAHFDDEYCALPLIWEAARQGLAQRFFYLADYRRPEVARRRHAETLAFLTRQGLAGDLIEPLGRGSGAFDGGLHRAAGELFERLCAASGHIGPVTRLVVPAWEGGHMDHDVCAFLAVRLAARLQHPPIRQFTLYNGPGLPDPLLRGGAPLADNGAVTPMRLSRDEWLKWMGEVRCFPSQRRAWCGLWPAMFSGMWRRGFGWQTLAPKRVEARPHAGRLLYERMFRTPYEQVRAALDAALPRMPEADRRPIIRPERG